MAASNPPVNGAAFIVYIALEDMANPGSYKSTPTLAAGDFKVSIDGGALANLATLPTNTPASSIWVKISLSGTEMTGDNISIQCIDQTNPKEWADYAFNVQTVAATWSTYAGGAVASVTGSVGSVAAGGIAASSFAAGAIDAAAIAANAIGASELATDAAQEIADTVRARQLTEGYAADGVAPTLEQAIFAIMQGLLEFSIASTTITTKKLDKATTAMTHTLDSATTPTSRTRAT